MSGEVRPLPGPGLQAATLLLGRPWTLLILATLVEEPRRFTEIVQLLRGISTNLLSERLRTLERACLIERQDDRGVSSYRLAGAGQALVPVLSELDAWGDGLAADAPAPPTP